jgi:peptide alpha-N-acetyltransferase
VKRAVDAMAAADAEEVVLEAEAGNSGALRLYRRLGFVRDKRLARYYLSGADAFRLKMLLPLPSDPVVHFAGNDASLSLQDGLATLSIAAEDAQ